MTQRLIDRVASLASARPEHLAIIGVRDTAVLSWSWRQLWQEATRTAALLERAGIGAGDVVAYQLPNRAEFVSITLAALMRGAICCPLMPFFRERELRYMLERARARVLFTPERFRGRACAEEAALWVEELPCLQQVIVLAESGAAPAGALPRHTRIAWEWFDIALQAVSIDAGASAPHPCALAQLLFTSGTTGAPKGVLHRQDVLLQASLMQSEHLGLGEADRIFVPSPLAHQTGFLYGMWLALALGVPQILQESWDAPRALQALRSWGGTFVQAATPFLLDLLQAVELGAEPPSTLRLFVATGAAVPRAAAQRASAALRTQVCGAFGTTEGCLATLCSPRDPPEKAWGSDGRALSGVQLRVRDESGAVLPANAEGLFEIHSPTMFEGYLEAPQATAQAYSTDGWYQTGDLALIDADGYLHVTGRVKDLINRGGEKIPVAEIEQLLYQHAAVQDVAIVAMPDARLVERACAFVVKRAAQRFDFAAMQAFLDERRVAKQYWPERLELLDALPRTFSGKIQKFALRERAKALAAAAPTQE